MTPSKRLWLHCCLFCILTGEIVTAGVAFESRETKCSAGDQCMSIQDCARYQNSSAILRSQLIPCGFFDKTPLVCCPANTTNAEPSTYEKLVNLLPTECGDPYRTLFNVPRPRGPKPVCPLDPELPPCVLASYNGVPAQEGKWPWMVLLGRWVEDSEKNVMPPTPGKLQLGKWFCGGVLITDRHVLTAAHCLRPEQVGSVGARLGEYDLSETLDVIHQDRNITRITRHEDFRGSQNDIAVVLLERPFDPSPTIRPICLPPAGFEHAGRAVDMAGWGQLGYLGDIPNVLQEVPLRVTDVLACERSYSRLREFESRFKGGFQGTKVCALSRDNVNRDACPGDSGGPLMAQRPGGIYELVGLVSGGVGCGNPEFPGIYTKVSAYISWILRNLT